MAQQYSVTSGVAATATATTIKVAIQLATPSTQSMVLIGFDVSCTGAATAGTWLVELVHETGVSSGGSSYTPLKYGVDQSKAALTTARINDTSDGSGPAIQQAWEVSNSGVFSYLWPLGRELFTTVSSWLAIRVTVPSGGATGYYVANAIYEE
jgi:hypothetical protein